MRELSEKRKPYLHIINHKRNLVGTLKEFSLVPLQFRQIIPLFYYFGHNIDSPLHTEDQAVVERVSFSCRTDAEKVKVSHPSHEETFLRCTSIIFKKGRIIMPTFSMGSKTIWRRNDCIWQTRMYFSTTTMQECMRAYSLRRNLINWATNCSFVGHIFWI